MLICGSGVGASVAANKVKGVRAGLCHDPYSAHQGVEHDDMNVLVMGGRVVGRRWLRSWCGPTSGANTGAKSDTSAASTKSRPSNSVTPSPRKEMDHEPTPVLAERGRRALRVPRDANVKEVQKQHCRRPWTRPWPEPWRTSALHPPALLRHE